jgi:Zinc-binding loop region of homing endonuclease
MTLNHFLSALQRRIESKCEVFGNRVCIRWGGTLRDQKGMRYGRMRVKFPVSRYYYVHRLVCQIHQNMERLPDGMHVSHLCHYSLCCNFSHLTWEPQVVNNQKQTCRDRAGCMGHVINGEMLPKCIFWYVFNFYLNN